MFVGVPFCIKGRRVVFTTCLLQVLTSSERRSRTTHSCMSQDMSQTPVYLVFYTMLRHPPLRSHCWSTRVGQQWGSGTREDNVTKPDGMRVDVGFGFTAKSINEFGYASDYVSGGHRRVAAAQAAG